MIMSLEPLMLLLLSERLCSQSPAPQPIKRNQMLSALILCPNTPTNPESTVFTFLSYSSHSAVERTPDSSHPFILTKHILSPDLDILPARILYQQLTFLQYLFFL